MRWGSWPKRAETGHEALLSESAEGPRSVRRAEHDPSEHERDLWVGTEVTAPRPVRLRSVMPVIARFPCADRGDRARSRSRGGGPRRATERCLSASGARRMRQRTAARALDGRMRRHPPVVLSGLALHLVGERRGEQPHIRRLHLNPDRRSRNRGRVSVARDTDVNPAPVWLYGRQLLDIVSRDA